MSKADKSNKPAASAAAAATALQGGTSVAPTAAAPVAFSMPEGYKVKRVLTLPSLVLKTAGSGAVIRFDSVPRVSKVKDKKDTKREPATIADVTIVADGGGFAAGEKRIFLIPAVVLSNLARDYGKGNEDGNGELDAIDIVGKVFAVQNMGKRTETQRYNDFNIAELEK